MRSTVRSTVLVTLFSLSAISAFSQQYMYTAITAPTGFSNIVAKGVNSSGVAVGYMQDASFRQQAFIWNGSAQMLSGLTGSTSSSALGINDAGDVIGTSTFSGGIVRSWIYSNGAYNALANGADGVRVTSINASSVVAGHQITSGSFTRGFFGNTMGVTFFSASELYLTTTAINNNGLIVGFAEGNVSPRRAFIRQLNGDIQFLDGASSSSTVEARGVNGAGVIIGNQSGTGGQAAIQWDNGVAHFLPGVSGLASSSAVDIAANGDVIGSATNGSIEKAILWRGSQGIDLSTLANLPSGTQLTLAWDVASEGSIVGQANGGTSFILRPVPEPASLLALGAGALAMVRKRKRKHLLCG